MDSSSIIDLTQINIPGFDPRTVKSVEQLSGGANNRVFKLLLKNSSPRVLKRYFRHPGDTRNRLQTEYGAFSVLWSHGLRCIPQPFGCDATAGYALYEYFEHEPLVSKEVSEADIQQVTDFIRQLSELAREPELQNQPPASESCFSLHELFDVIEKRLSTLQAVDAKQNPATEAFEQFLNGKLIPAYERAKKSAQKIYGTKEHEKLPLEFRTLSPSDIGFHNALKKKDGSWVFQDFEYFGWDDPAKLIIDFELQPSVLLSRSQKLLWRNEALAIFSAENTLGTRVQALCPLYATKWSIILLNEFVPEYRARRNFASSSIDDLHAIQLRQLEKASAMCEANVEPHGQ